MFHVGSVPLQGAAPGVYLLRDNWNDWFSFQTMFTMFVIAPDGSRHNPGSVKIGHAGLQGGAAIAPGVRGPDLPPQFPELGAGYFSLGQDENYYETLNNLDPDFRERIFRGLQDCAFNLSIFERHRNETSMSESILRSVSARNVVSRLNRLAHGNAVLTRFEFLYGLPYRGSGHAPPALQFSVIPDSVPPTNIHVIVGRNGVGKTTCLQSLTNTILGRDVSQDERGSVSQTLSPGEDAWSFAGLVSVSFSAFDDYVPPQPAELRMRAAFVGLRKEVQTPEGSTYAVKGPADLLDDFVASMNACRSGPRQRRWRRAVETLSTDPLFAQANVAMILDVPEADWVETASRLYRRLSSGHAIVLLTTTKLVELVDERTLVVLDEPEGHLHPPLLSAFIRAMADLLISRNGVAIVATHSPVVLQEVPRSCVWKLRRFGPESVAERPDVETFGENVGVLTREVFGLEVTQSGFHRLISEAARRPNATYESVIAHFQGQLGAEGKALVRGLVALNGPTGERN
ncbi:MAG: AAA family ATPase [Aquabacterium sp.]